MKEMPEKYTLYRTGHKFSFYHVFPQFTKNNQKLNTNLSNSHKLVERAKLNSTPIDEEFPLLAIARTTAIIF